MSTRCDATARTYRQNLRVLRLGCNGSKTKSPASNDHAGPVLVAGVCLFPLVCVSSCVCVGGGGRKQTAEFVEVPGSGWGQVSVSHLRRPRPAAAAHTRASAIALCTSLRWKASIRRCLDGPSRIESTSPRRLRTSAMKDGLPSILTISEASDRK